MLGPVLLVGCGGSGGKTLRVARAAMERRFRRLGYPPGFMPAGIQFIHVDVPAKQEGSVSDFGDYLPGEDYVSMVSPGVKYGDVDESLMSLVMANDELDELVGWRPNPSGVKVPIGEGAGQFRALGRIITLRRMSDVYAAITSANARFSTAAARDELDELSGRLGFPVSASQQDRPQPLAVVVSSLAGGTGAGCVIDVCDVLRASYSWGDNPLVALFAPDVFRSVAGTSGAQSNALAALSEVLAGYWSEEGQWGTGLLQMSNVPRRRGNQGGVARPFIIGSMNQGGVSLGSPKLVFQAVGEALGMIVSNPKVREDLVNFLNVNWQSQAEKNPDSLELTGPTTSAPLSSFGFARAGLGRERFEEYAVKRLARDAAEYLANGYLLSAQSMFPGEDLTPDEAQGRLVEHLSLRFMSDCGLHERDENDQVIDALRHPEIEARWMALRNTVLTSIERAEPAQPTVWAQRIWDEVDQRRASFDAASASFIAEQTRQWVEAAPARVTEVVSSYLSRYGVPVASALVRYAAGELVSVADQLIREASDHEHEAGQAQSRIGATLPVVGKELIVGAHPKMAEAVRQGASGLWLKVEADIRRQASAMMLEFSKGLLTPMLQALAAAQAGLEDDLKPQANGDPAEVFDWPKDRALPAWVHPAHIEFLLEPVTGYPDTFTELVNASVNQVDTGAAGGPMLAARHQVITGKFELDGPLNARLGIVHGTGINERDTSGTWQPKITGHDGTPARFQVRLRVPDLLSRARSWVSRPGTRLDLYLNEQLSEYLSTTDAKGQPVANHGDRLGEFRTAFSKALKASDPLVLIDASRYSSVHPKAGSPTFSCLIEPIPFDTDHPARALAEELLVAKGIDPNLIASYFTTGTGGSISVVSYLDLPAHPVVFRSLVEPIASAWQGVGKDSGEAFWKWCRSRPLTEAIGLPTASWRSMIRGWFTAKVLGLLDASDAGQAATIADPIHGVLKFPYPMLGPKISRKDKLSALPAVLESYSVAMVRFSTSGDRALLDPYRRLLRLGLCDAEAFDLSYSHPSEEIEHWIETGEVDGPSVGDVLVSGATPDERAQNLSALLEQSAAEYRKLAAKTVRQDNFFEMPRVLELAHVIAEELTLMAAAVNMGSNDGPGL